MENWKSWNLMPENSELLQNAASVFTNTVVEQLSRYTEVEWIFLLNRTEKNVCELIEDAKLTKLDAHKYFAIREFRFLCTELLANTFKLLPQDFKYFIPRIWGGRELHFNHRLRIPQSNSHQSIELQSKALELLKLYSVLYPWLNNHPEVHKAINIKVYCHHNKHGIQFESSSRPKTSITSVLELQTHLDSLSYFQPKLTSDEEANTVYWLKSESELKQLFQRLADEGFIASDSLNTPFLDIHFQQLNSSANQAPSLEPMQWLKSNPLLVYLFDQLADRGFIIPSNSIDSFLQEYFTTKKVTPVKNVKQTRSNYKRNKGQSNKEEGKPIGFQSIDELLNELDKEPIAT